MDPFFAVTVVVVVMAVPVLVWVLFRLTDHIDHHELLGEDHTSQGSGSIRHHHVAWEQVRRDHTQAVSSTSKVPR